MEWAMETVLPREARKLASAIEEKDAAIALLNDDLKNREYENMVLQVQRDVYQTKFATLLSIVMFLVQKIRVRTTLL